jgi:hypothetical protein
LIRQRVKVAAFNDDGPAHNERVARAHTALPTLESWLPFWGALVDQLWVR